MSPFFFCRFSVLSEGEKKRKSPTSGFPAFHRPPGDGGWIFQVDPYIHRINDTARRHFAGMVTALDEGIGNVTNALEDREI